MFNGGEAVRHVGDQVNAAAHQPAGRAAITKDAVTGLGLSTGSSVIALIKSTQLSLATA